MHIFPEDGAGVVYRPLRGTTGPREWAFHSGSQPHQLYGAWRVGRMHGYA
jgi:hypothetical protein